MATRLQALTRQYKREDDRQKKDMLRFQIQGEVTRILASTLDQYSDCLDQIVETVSVIMGAERVSLLVRRRNFLEIASAVGMSEDTLRKRPIIRVGQGIAGKVAETGEPVMVGDLTRDKSLKKHAVGGSQYKSNAFVCLPLKSDEKVVGVINVSNPKDGNTFNKPDFNFLKKTADLIGVMLHKSMQIEGMKQKTGHKGRIPTPATPLQAVPQSALVGKKSVSIKAGVRPKRKPFKTNTPKDRPEPTKKAKKKPQHPPPPKKKK
ncbi:MAG: GAF domain-containing protein [Deltaproteobacteria bacterium]|nr:GAF domain-containing protein [Deltaproteobacteria bacterium]